jgi:hypothetical protein
VALLGLFDDLAVIGVHAKVHGVTPVAVQLGGPELVAQSRGVGMLHAIVRPLVRGRLGGPRTNA